MEYLNRIEIRGIVGDAKTTRVGDFDVARFNVSTDYSFECGDGSIHTETTCHRVAAWSGENMPDLHEIVEGARVHVIGRLRILAFPDMYGTLRSTYEVIASEVRIINK